MPVWLQVVVYIVAILSLVMIHEAGHFLTAKAFGIKVQEFFVGFGPRLWSFRRGETEYGLKALPFGGYVRIAGMNPFEEVPPEDVSRTFQAKPIWQRAIVIATGPVTHFVMAVVFAAVLIAVVGTPSRYRAEVISVERTLNGLPSPASRVGLRAGDVIESVNGRRVPVSRDPGVINGVIGATRESVGKPIVVGIRREGRLMIFRPIPELSDVDGESVGRIGVIIGSKVVAVEHANPIVALGRGAMFSFDRGKEIIFQFDNVFGPSGLSRLANQVLGRETRGEGDVSSVVGGGQILVQASEEIGFGPALLQLLVVFNIFIGILNLVPLPPLDGGHLAVLAYEKVRRRRPDVRKLIPLTALVAAFMIVFALSILYLDIVKPIQIP
jgi:membrane-associated protease RseP (regulator of RpoE activity)